MIATGATEEITRPRIFAGRFRVGFLILLFLFGFLFVAGCARWGIGTSPDSLAYFTGAENIANGYGFSALTPEGEYAPITHYAPLYSLLLAGPIRLGVSYLQAARWINAVLLGLLIVLVFWLARRLDPAGGKGSEAVWAAAAVLAFLGVVEIYLMAWSEALFLPLLLISIGFLIKHFESGRTGWLLASALTMGLACLVRFAGFGLVAAGGLAVLLLSPGRRRILQALVYVIVAATPPLLWMALAGGSSGGAVGSREISFHPITVGQLQEGLATLGAWMLVPAGAPAVVKLLPYLALSGALGYELVSAWRRKDRSRFFLDGLPRLVWIGMIFIPIYGLFLLFSISFMDANTPLDRRILSPVYLMGVFLVVYIYRRAAALETDYKLKGWALALLLGVFILVSVVRAAPFAWESFSAGLGFSSRQWRDSALISQASELAVPGWVYSNAPEAVALHTGLPAFLLPKKFDSSSRQENLLYSQEMEEMMRSMQEQDSRVIFFTQIQRSNLPPLDELLDVSGLVILSQAADGVILGLPR